MLLLIKQIILLIISFLSLQINDSLCSISVIDTSKCKSHFSRSETSYTKFFKITDNFRNPDKSLVFDFHFSVQAPQDAHILLTPSTVFSTLDPVYEIVIGAGENNYSDIRRLQKSGTKQFKNTKNILSAYEIRSFWVHVSNSGLIEIGYEGNLVPFLSWKDPSPLPIQYFSFSTFLNVEAMWFYDCFRKDGTTSNSKEVEPELSITEKLKKMLFTNYDPYARPTIHPEDSINIVLSSNFDRVHLDESSAILITDGIMQMQWLDEKINWDHEDYNNIENLHLHFREIWLPDLYLYNSANGPGLGFLKSVSIVVSSEGWVTWITQVHMESWCDSSGLGHWPNDAHNCDIELGFWTEEKYIFLDAHINKTTQKYISEWEIKEIVLDTNPTQPLWSIEEMDSYSISYVIKITLQRYAGIYNTLFFTPLFVIHITLLLSFWLPPVGSYRISLHCFQLVLLSVMLIRLSISIPAHPTNIPNIVLLYSYGFVAVLIALIFSIIFMNWAYTKHTKPIPYFIYNLLQIPLIKSIVYVHNSKFSESYNNLISDDPRKNIDIQMMWTVLGIAIDRLLFLVYFTFFIICLSTPY